MDAAGKITKEEAITILYGIRADNLNFDDAYAKDKYYALDMAITALEQEPCEDAISRHAVLETIDSRIEQIKRDANKINESYSHLSFAEGVHDGYCRLKCDLRILPSVNPTKTGHWIPVSERLPEIDEPVLIFQRYYEGVNITIGRYHSDEEQGGYRYWQWIKYDNHFSYGIDHFGIICPGSYYVDAWMPLPQPYEPQESEGKE